jgi:hypothetical protein
MLFLPQDFLPAILIISYRDGKAVKASPNL